MGSKGSIKMSEELIQRNLIEAPDTMGAWNYYNIGATTLKALKGAKIIPNRDYEEFEGKKPDAIIVKKPQIIAAIEYKQPKEFRTEKQIEAAIGQEIGTARALGAKLYIVTDGKKTFWINPLTGNEITAEDGSRIALNFSKDDVECIKLINKAVTSINTANDCILASLVVDPLPLAQRVWQDLWSVSGASPENCLYTFVEIFIFKYLSDLGILTGLHSFPNLLNQYKTNTENEVIDYYASTVRVKIKELFPMNQKDKTTVINGTIFVSKDDKAISGYATVFKKILERFDSFGTLENIDYDFKSKLFETFLKESISKKNWGQFFTPLKVVRAIVSMTDITPGMTICDPACGVGKFLLELILHDIHRWFKIKNGTLIPQVALHGFDKGFDKDEQKTIILAKANMLIYMSAMIREHPGLTEQFAQLFNDTFLLQTNSILGTLANPEVEKYDLILTNPPYVMSGSSNLKDEISKKTPEEVINKRKSLLEQHYTISAMGVEGLFMEWIIRALKPGGKAFVVVPDGIMNRSNDKRLRDFILDECVIDAVISLPLNTFFTTNKKTYIMALTRKIPASSGGITTKARQTSPVFVYLCSEIGETRDVYRFDIEQNNLGVAAINYNMFKGAREQYTTDDKRCKIISIDEFYNGLHWSVERWWTREEKIELGIEDGSNTADINQFVSIISDIAASMSSYQEPLLELEKKKSSERRLRQVSLLDEKLFTLISSGIGLNRTKLTATDTHDKHDIPVYTASKAPIAFIKAIENKNPIEASEEQPLLSFATNGDGSAGRNFVIHIRPFYINTDRIAVVMKHERILLPYMHTQLSDMKEKYGFSHSHKANRNGLIEVMLNIPVNETGEFDIVEQSAIAEQFIVLNDIRNELTQKYTELVDCDISVDLSGYQMCEFTLGDILESVKGKSKYTKKYGDTHKGEYPVYSASANSPLTHIGTYDYDGDYLSWSTNGFAGTVTILSNKFSVNGDRGILLPKQSGLDIQYLKYILQPLFRDLAKGRKGDRGADEFTKLYPSMIEDIQVPLPVDEESIISLPIQQEIAKTYGTVEQYKRDVLDKLNVLITQKVNL
jgi:type I restriction-modification system DNA methylase subunit